MDSLIGDCPITKQIASAEETIKNCYDRVDMLERKLRNDDIPDNKRYEIETELTEIRKLLETNEDQLSKLHKHNRKTFAFAAALCFVCFTVYALYILVQGNDF